MRCSNSRVSSTRRFRNWQRSAIGHREVAALSEKQFHHARELSPLKCLQLVRQPRFPPAVGPRPGVDDDATAERSPGRLVADDETVAAERQERLRKNDLAKCGLFGFGDGW